MSIEKDLERIASALERIEYALSEHTTQRMQHDEDGTPVTPPPAAKKTKKSASPVDPTVTKEMLADALRECVQKAGPTKTKEVLNIYGATKLSEVKSEDIEKCQMALSELARM